MTAAIPSLFNPVNGDFEAVDGELQPEMRARRLHRRRQTLILAAASHVINTALLGVFAAAGTIATSTVLIFAACAALSVGVFAAISESGISDNWRDHFFAGPYTAATFGLLLGFIYIVPDVAIVFLCALFLVANVVAMRATPRQGVVSWIIMTAGIVALYTLTDLPLSLPAGNKLELLGTLLTFSSTIGRSMFIGIFASVLRDSLFRRRLELEAAYKRIEELAELDELTGSFNRRCIMRLLDDEIVRAQRSGSPCAVVLIDLDLFKQINDRFGHPTGDEVLRTFAITMFANIRSIDKFGRYGGEEFLLVMPDTSRDMAVKGMNRLRQIVETLDWTAFSDGLTVTISAGVATLRPDDTPDSLLARSDRALYAAKERGRNLIASA